MFDMESTIKGKTKLSATGTYDELIDGAELHEIGAESLRYISITEHAVYIYFKDYNKKGLKIVRRGQL